MQWFTPAPWKTVECDIDLRPGGRFRTLMRSPDGQDFPDNGCYLEIVPDEKLVWTNALAPDFRPVQPAPGALHFTATIALETVPGGTRYSARAIHGDAESCARHAAMGFEAGWGKALEQLVAMVKRM